MQLKKHNSKTPPERKPKWLRKGIALLAAVATLATGGVVASTAYAEGDTGGGGNAGGGPTGGGGSFNLQWNYGDRGKGFGPSSDWNSTRAAITNGANGFRGLGWSVEANGDAWIKEATQEADTNCEARVQKVYPGAPKSCRVVGVGIVGSSSKQYGYPGGASHSIWMNYWNSAIAGANHSHSYDNGAGYNYRTNTPFPKDPDLSIDKIADTYAPDWVNGVSTGTIVVIALSRYEPAPASFTPTISTEAPHIIQEGQPITDKVTVGVKSGDHWIDGTSVTAKGYYFTGSKDAILKGISPSGGINSDADIASYLGRVRSGGEYPWVAGVGVRYGLIGPDPARGRVMATQTLQGQGGKGDGGRPGVCATGGEGWAAGMPLRTTSRLCLSPVELGLVCGQDGFVVFFRSVGQEDCRLSHFQSRLVQGQQYPGSLASEVFPAGKQDCRIRAYDLKHSFMLVEVGYAGVPQQSPQGRNTRLRGSRLRVFDGPQLAEE